MRRDHASQREDTAATSSGRCALAYRRRLKPAFIPTVSLDVISLMASSCGYYRGQIEDRLAHEFAGHVATQRELAERTEQRHLPRAQSVAPVR
jgi:hypothetical protein